MHIKKKKMVSVFQTKQLTGLLEFIKLYFKQNPSEDFFFLHYLPKLYMAFKGFLLWRWEEIIIDFDKDPWWSQKL